MKHKLKDLLREVVSRRSIGASYRQVERGTAENGRLASSRLLLALDELQWMDSYKVGGDNARCASYRKLRRL